MLRSILCKPDKFERLRALHPDYNTSISARLLQSIFRPELTTHDAEYEPRTDLQKAWQEEAKKWPRKWFQFFRRDVRLELIHPQDTKQIIHTSIGQANFLRWLIEKEERIADVIASADAAHASSKRKHQTASKRTISSGVKKKHNQTKKQAVVKAKKKKTTARPPAPKQIRRARAVTVPKPKKISDPLDDDIKPRLSSKIRSRQSPTYCTYNTAWMELKQKNPSHKIRIVY